MQQKTYFANFYNIEFGLKSGNTPYVEGYITTDDIDYYNEQVTPEAMEGMLKTLQSGKVKLDVEHSQFLGDGPDLPIGRIVEAKKVEHNGKVSIWVKATLNQAHQKFGEVWDSIKGGFLDGFSIAYNIKEKARDFVNGTEVTLLKGVDLLNVALTGNPVNAAAGMTGHYMKAKYIRREGTSGNYRYYYTEKKKGSSDKDVSSAINELVDVMKAADKLGEADIPISDSDIQAIAMSRAMKLLGYSYDDTFEDPMKRKDLMEISDMMVSEARDTHKKQKKDEDYMTAKLESATDRGEMDINRSLGDAKYNSKQVAIESFRHLTKPENYSLIQKGGFNVVTTNKRASEFEKQGWIIVGSGMPKGTGIDADEIPYRARKKSTTQADSIKTTGGIQMPEEEKPESPELKAAPKEEKVKEEDDKKDDDTEKKDDEETKSIDLKEYTALKAKVEEQSKVIAEMKAFLEKPQLKALAGEPAQEQQKQTEETKTPLQMIA